MINKCVILNMWTCTNENLLPNRCSSTRTNGLRTSPIYTTMASKNVEWGAQTTIGASFLLARLPRMIIPNPQSIHIDKAICLITDFICLFFNFN